MPTAIPDRLPIEAKVFGDRRGLFFERFNRQALRGACRLDVPFVHGTHSKGARHVLRGLPDRGRPDYSARRFERRLAGDDAEIGIKWPLTAAPPLSAKDAAGAGCSNAERF